MAATVYQATNLINGKRYIGVTIRTLEQRKAKHVHDATAASSFRQHLPFMRAIRKYGPENIRFRALKVCDDIEDAMAEERRLIAILAPEYNATKGGEGVWGHRHTPETKAKMSAAKKGKPSPKKGSVQPDHVKQKVSRSVKAYMATLTEEQRRALMTMATAAVLQPVIRIEDGKRFSSIKEAATECGLGYQAVRYRCRAGNGFRRAEA